MSRHRARKSTVFATLTRKISRQSMTSAVSGSIDSLTKTLRRNKSESKAIFVRSEEDAHLTLAMLTEEYRWEESKRFLKEDLSLQRLQKQTKPIKVYFKPTKHTEMVYHLFLVQVVRLFWLQPNQESPVKAKACALISTMCFFADETLRQIVANGKKNSLSQFAPGKHLNIATKHIGKAVLQNSGTFAESNNTTSKLFQLYGQDYEQYRHPDTSVLKKLYVLRKMFQDCGKKAADVCNAMYRNLRIKDYCVADASYFEDIGDIHFGSVDVLAGGDIDEQKSLRSKIFNTEFFCERVNVLFQRAAFITRKVYIAVGDRLGGGLDALSIVEGKSHRLDLSILDQILTDLNSNTQYGASFNLLESNTIGFEMFDSMDLKKDEVSELFKSIVQNVGSLKLCSSKDRYWCEFESHLLEKCR